MDTTRRLVAGIAAGLRPLLEEIDGFISIERFERLTQPGKPLSLSFRRDEEAIAEWHRVDWVVRARRSAPRAALRRVY